MISLKQLTYGGRIRAFGTLAAPLYAAFDVCACLDVEDMNGALARLEKEHVIDTDVESVMGERQRILLVTEPGLFLLVMTSRKTGSRKIKGWILREVLPAVSPR